MHARCVLVTRVNRRCLPQALVLIDSILACHRDEPRIVALCEDDESEALLDAIRVPQVVTRRVDPGPGPTAAMPFAHDDASSDAESVFLPATALLIAPLRVPLPAAGAPPTRPERPRIVAVGDIASGAVAVDRAGRPMTPDGPAHAIDFPSFVTVAPDLHIADAEGHLARCASLATAYTERVSRAMAVVDALGAAPSARGDEVSHLVSAPTFVAARRLAPAIAQRALPHRRVEASYGWDLYFVGEDPAAAAPVNPVLWAPRMAPPVPWGQPAAPDAAVRVTAIVSAYASSALIGGCLRDLEGQTLFARGSLEVIVVDSASPEDEATVVAPFVARHPHRIRYLRTPQREGVYMAWNRGAALARGAYLTNANTDDRHRPDALERLACALDAAPQVGLAYADSFVTDQEDGTFFTAPRRARFAWPDYDHCAALHGCFAGPQPMWRRALHDEVGWFDQRYRVAGDYEMWLRIAERCPWTHVPETLGLYLSAPGGVENSNRARCIRETLAIRARYARRAGVTLTPARYPDSYAVPVAAPWPKTA
ncbi:MAG: glycosyltransferase [Myxococcota bacterium]